MESRESRFWLRFESGARQGEAVPLPAGASRIGRRPDCGIVVADGSVSGHHAELLVSAAGVALRDLGSTNGTRVGGSRLEEEVAVAHGDEVVFGDVRAVLVDGRLAGEEAPQATPRPVPAPPVPTPPAAAPAPAAPTVHAPVPAPEPTVPSDASGELATVDEGRLQASGQRSRAGLLIGLLVLVLAGTGGFYAWQLRGSGGGAAAARPRVQALPDNLLGHVDATFEDTDGAALGWEAVDAAPAVLERDAGFAATGRLGLGAALGAGEWALSYSPEVRLNERRAVALSASVWAEDGVEARVGIELASSTGVAPTFVAWAPSVHRSDGFEEAALSFDGLPGYDRGRAVLAARADADGAASFDDVGIVASTSAAAPKASLLEFEARVLGAPGSTAALVRGGRTVIGGIGCGGWGPDGLAGWGRGRWSVAAEEDGVVFSTEGAPEEAVLRFAVNATLPEASVDEGEAWIASLGPEGYRSHASEFELEAASSLLLGRGIDLLRVGFAEPVKIVGRVSDGALRVRAHLAGQQDFRLQLSFRAERVQAGALRETAQAAERSGDRAAALGDWSTLLDTYPFDGQLVAEAQAARARLIQEGLDESSAVRAELERARFFDLTDLFDDCRRRAAALAASYPGTEVEDEARRLLAAVDEELALHGDGEAELRRAHLRAVRGAIAEAAPELAAHIDRALEEGGE